MASLAQTFFEVVLFRELSGVHAPYLPVDSPGSRGSDVLNFYQNCAVTSFNLLYALFLVIPWGITQKKAYNIQNTAKV